MLLNTELQNLVLSEGDGTDHRLCIGISADKTGYTADRVDDVPRLIGHDHFHQHIAGVDLALYSFGTGVSHLSDRLHGNQHLVNEILKMAVLNTFFDGGFNGILIPGVGMDYIPLSFFCHGLTLP